MRYKTTPSQARSTRLIRCAIYTRKSTEEGLEQPFNSLDAQREAAEAYIASQRHQGWKVVEERFDDGGESGGKMGRPARQRVLPRIPARAGDCLRGYEGARRRRSLLALARAHAILVKQSGRRCSACSPASPPARSIPSWCTRSIGSADRYSTSRASSESWRSMAPVSYP